MHLRLITTFCERVSQYSPGWPWLPYGHSLPSNDIIRITYCIHFQVSIISYSLEVAPSPHDFLCFTVSNTRLNWEDVVCYDTALQLRFSFHWQTVIWRTLSFTCRLFGEIMVSLLFLLGSCRNSLYVLDIGPLTDFFKCLHHLKIYIFFGHVILYL